MILPCAYSLFMTLVVSLSGKVDGLENPPRSITERTSDTVWVEPTAYHAPLHISPEPYKPPTPLHPTGSGIPSEFPVTALGGTFDHLHAGHKILLSMAAWITSEKLIVGMTGRLGYYADVQRINQSNILLSTDDALLKNKANKRVLEHLPVRTERVRAFLTLFKQRIHYDIVPINDVYGPTAWDPNIQALVVSKETLPGAAASELTDALLATLLY